MACGTPQEPVLGSGNQSRTARELPVPILHSLGRDSRNRSGDPITTYASPPVSPKRKGVSCVAPRGLPVWPQPTQIWSVSDDAGEAIDPSNADRSSCDDRSEDALRACEECLATGDAVLFVGAGCSIPSGYPSWPRLLETLESACDEVKSGFVRDKGLREADSLGYAEKLRQHLSSGPKGAKRYHELLYQRFVGPPALTPFHDDLVALPVRGFLTTNYDNTIQTSLMRRPGDFRPVEKTVIVDGGPANRETDFYDALRTRSSRLVAHVHGYFTHPETIVLTATDYRRAYGESGIDRAPTRVESFLKQVFTGYPVIFVGFSFQDPYFVRMLEAIANQLGTWGRARHFALMPTTRERKAEYCDAAASWRERLSIATAFYPNDDNTHSALQNVIRDLRGKTESQGKSVSQLNQINMVTRRGLIE